MKQIARVLLGIVVLAALWQPAAAFAQTDSSDIVLNARAGFDGFYKIGDWVPVQVALENTGSNDMDVVVSVTDATTGNRQVRYSRQLAMPAGARKAVMLVTPVDSFVRHLNVEVTVNGDVIATSRATLDDIDGGDMLIGVWAANPSVFGYLRVLPLTDGSAFVAQLDAADLPESSAGWQALDVLVVSDVDTGVLTPAQRRALENWVAAGGRLIVATGPGAAKTTAGLAGLMPATLGGSSTLGSDALAALAGFAIADSPSGELLAAALTPAATATVPVRVGNTPLIITASTGAGDVTVLAFDPALAPLSDWSQASQLFQQLLANTTDRPGWAVSPRNWYNGGEAITAIPGIDFPSLLLVCGFLGLYVLAVGPVNFIVLRRIKRRELAWATIPVLVLLFTAIAWGLGVGQRGNKPLLHRLAVVEAWEGADTARVSGIVGLFSPSRTTYDVALSPDLMARPIPDDFYYNNVSTLTDVQVDQGDTPLIADLRLDVAEVKAFTVTGHAAAPVIDSDLLLDINAGGSSLSGTLTNLSEFVLADAVLLVGGGVQELGNLDPGQTVTVSLNASQSQALPAVLQGGYPVVLPVSLDSSTVAGPANPVSPTVGGGYGYDTTVDDILGSVAVNYYDDRESYRRYSLLTWLMESYSGYGRGSGTYLVGWVDDGSPLDVSIANINSNTSDLTLYIIRLSPGLQQSGNIVTVPPGLMSWQVVDTTGGVTTPYDFYLYDGYATLRFAPQPIVTYTGVTELTLHLSAYGSTGPINNMRLHLWDVTRGDWIEVPNLQWGDNVIADPAGYVAEDGAIYVKVEYPGSAGIGSLSVEALDFTMVMER